jgi:hypothetical protein
MKGCAWPEYLLLLVAAAKNLTEKYYTDSLVHLKTVGTSYLEALRLIAFINTQLFRAILDFARAYYETDRKTYHVSASLNNAPRIRTTHKHLHLTKKLDNKRKKEYEIYRQQEICISFKGVLYE